VHSISRRAARWPLALTLAVVGACSDEPSAPSFSMPLRPNAAAGDVFVVTNANDSGLGSLRWALGFTTGGEVIRFDPALAGRTITLDSTLYIYESVTIEGPTGARVTIDGGRKGRVLMARFIDGLTLRNLSLTGGNSPSGGGVVVYSEGDVTLENTVLYDNYGDAGIAVVGEHVTLVNSTVTGTTNASGTTFPYPAVMGDTVTLINSTVAHNGWGGVGSFFGVVRLRNSIVSNNVGVNCVTTSNTALVREGANISDDDTCGGPSEIIIADPKLASLADNGGPTQTHALLAGSPAINAGTGCSVPVDQRFFPRDAQCDLGAFEFADFTTVTITIDPSAPVNQSNGWATLTGTVKCSRDETFALALELHQPQRAGKETIDVHSATTEPVTCSTVARPWSASMVLSEGAFQNGNATATAVTFEAEPWVAPASATAPVKLYRSRGK
jgi:hypothetical protein